MLPLRADLADLLRQARGDAGDGDPIVTVLPRIPTHRKYLAAAGIPWEDAAGRRADVHCPRHSHIGPGVVRGDRRQGGRDRGLQRLLRNILLRIGGALS